MTDRAESATETYRTLYSGDAGPVRELTKDESFAQAILDPDGIRPVPMDILHEFISTEKVIIATHRLVEKGIMVKTEDVESMVNDAFRCDLETYMVGILDEKMLDYAEWPVDWWEALKERFAPQWFINRYPIVYQHRRLEVQAYKAVCPHIAGDDEQCRGFLVGEYRR